MTPDAILTLPDLDWRPLGADRGVTARLWHVRWAGGSGVLKLCDQGERAAREQRFYALVDDGVGVPHCLDAGEHGGERWLLLEDLTAADAGDILAGVGADRAVAMAATLGRLHARWWGAAPAGWAPPDRAPVPDLDALAVRFAEEHGGRARAELATLGARLEAARAVLAEAPQTLVHADAHLDNWVFRPAPVLLDWQTVRAGPGAQDLCRVILEGVRPEVRPACQAAMVDAWRAELPGVSRAQAWEWVRAALVTSLAALIPHALRTDPARLSPRFQRVHARCAEQAVVLTVEWLG